MSNYADSHFDKDPNSSWFKAFNYITSKSKVLDIGCSSGNFGEVIIKDKQCVVDGIELDSGDFKEAKTKLRNVYQLNVEVDDLSFITEKYDFIYFGDVIEHLVTPIPTLKRVKSLLNSTGAVVFSIPNMSHLSVRLMLLRGDFLRGETGLLDKTHLHFYTHAEVQRVFSGAGYYISDLDPVLKDTPKEILEQELNTVGLTLTKEFIDFAATTEASVYQFVGMAKPATQKTKSQQLDISSPVDKFQAYLNQTKEHYIAVVANKDEHIAKQDVTINELHKELEHEKNELDRLRHNPILQVTEKVKEARNKLRK
jgi:2-polyprenyl-3-methyl-5-hydroxy-6-metoxy-1,4-benzoquinol methylase